MILRAFSLAPEKTRGCVGWRTLVVTEVEPFHNFHSSIDHSRKKAKLPAIEKRLVGWWGQERSSFPTHIHEECQGCHACKRGQPTNGLPVLAHEPFFSPWSQDSVVVDNLSSAKLQHSERQKRDCE